MDSRLIEVLIAMAIMTAAGCAFVSLIVIAQSIARVQPEAADQQQRARMAVQALAADVARAGAGVDRGAQAGPLGRYFSPLQVSADGSITVWYVVQPHRPGATDRGPGERGDVGRGRHGRGVRRGRARRSCSTTPAVTIWCE